MTDKKKSRYGMPHYTEYDLYGMDKETLVWAYCFLQDKFEYLRDCDYADLEERYRILNVRVFGRSSEKSRIINGNSSKEPGKEPGNTAEKTPDKKNNQDGDGVRTEERKKGRNRPVRSKGCASKVTGGLPVIDEDIELSEDELKAIFGPDVKYTDDPNFEKTYD